MPVPSETGQRGAALNPHWLAFWEIVRREARRLRALEQQEKGDEQA